MNFIFSADGRRFFLLLAIALLSSCATTIKAPTTHSQALWHIHRDQVAQLNDWQLRGKIAVNTAEEGWSANVIWTQQGDEYQLRFTAPLGQGSMRLNGQRGYARLRTSDGGDFQAASPDALVRDVLEVSVPVSNLYTWIRGLPNDVDHADIRGLSENGQLTHLTQAGWNIEFSRYQPTEKLWLPKKIILKKDEITVKIFIGRWQFDPQQIRNVAVSV